MALTIIKRVTCDVCDMEEPAQWREIGPKPVIICHNCVRILGVIDGNALFEFARSCGIDWMAREVSRLGDEAYPLRYALDDTAVTHHLREFAKAVGAQRGPRDKRS